MPETYIACLDLTSRETAILELEQLFDTNCQFLSEKWILFSSSKPFSCAVSTTIALTKELHKVIENFDSIATCCSHAHHHIKNSYALSINYTHKSVPRIDEKNVFDSIYHSISKPVVNLHSPDNNYSIVLDNNRIFFTKIINFFCYFFITIN